MNNSARIVRLAMALAVPGVSASQNLVPNGSFEDYTQCPQYFGYAHYATGWQNLHTNSADYFHRCQTNLVAGVPFNTCGYQEPAHGDAYVGMVTTAGSGIPWYREIVGIELTQPLQIGVPVCLSFKMAIGGFGSWNGGSALFTSNGVGLRFFNAFPNDWPGYLYPNAAALSLDVVPTDTAIWYVVNGVYLPDSDYTHLAIGNFFTDSLSYILPLDTTGYGGWGVSYAFIDDVRVSYDLSYCNINALIEPTSRSADLKAYPDPFVDRFTVDMGRPADGALYWELLDARGRGLLNGAAHSGAKSFIVSAGSLGGGTCILIAKDDAGVYAPIRMVSVSP